jgi:hypothetical protein
MSAMFAKIMSTLKHYRHAENPVELPGDTISTAAFPGADEPEQIHKGKRRLKENYSNHWDMDYLPRHEIDRLYEEEPRP